MTRTKFKIPACAVNPVTEKPYTRHKWEIVQGRLGERQGRLYYHVVCARDTCKLNSPNPVAF